MAKLFTTSQIKRISRVVRDVESRGPQSKNTPSGTGRTTASFWAILTGEDPANAGRYSFEKQVPEVYEMVESSPAVAVTDYTALEVNEFTGLVGDRVFLTFYGYDTSDPPKALYRFDSTTHLPSGQFQGMGFRTVAQWQPGWDWDRDTAIIIIV